MLIAAGLLVAMLVGVSAAAGGQHVIREGVTYSGLSGARGGRYSYSIDVPRGTREMVVAAWGGSGEVDLAVGRAGRGEAARHEFRGRRRAGQARIVIEAPQPGAWFVSVYGRESFRDLSMLVRLHVAAGYVSCDDSPILLGDGRAVGPLAASAGRWVRFRVRVPRGARRLSIASGGGRGNCDLYVGFDSPPSPSRYALRQCGAGTSESVEVHNPTAGDWHVLLYGRSAFSGVSLVARCEGEFRIEAIEPTPHRRRRDAFESDDESDRAGLIYSGRSQFHTIWPDEDVDRLEFVPPCPGQYAVRLTGITTPLKGELRACYYDGKEKRIRKFEVGRGAATLYLAAAGHTRRFKIKIEAEDDDDTGSYVVTVCRVGPVPRTEIVVPPAYPRTIVVPPAYPRTIVVPVRSSGGCVRSSGFVVPIRIVGSLGLRGRRRRGRFAPSLGAHCRLGRR